MNVRLIFRIPLILLAAPLFAAGQVPGGAEPTGELTIDSAIATALQFNPTLAAAATGVSAAEARLDQAGLYDNPEFDLEIENFGGSGERSGFDAAETTFAVSQPLLLGGKIAARKGVAAADLRLAASDADAVRLDIVAVTTIAFNTVLVAQERVWLTEELADLAKSFGDTVRSRVEAGKVSPVEAIRARAAIARAQVDVATAKRALAAARVGMASTWGSSDPQFSRAVGPLPQPTPPPPRASLGVFLELAPEMQRLTAEVHRQEQTIQLEKALGAPDLKLTLGPRTYRETGGWAWVGGVSLPLPIFNRNQGARRAAEFELERKRHEVAARRVALESLLSRILERLLAIAEETQSYEKEIIPASSEAFDAMSIGFREGKFGFLEVLDAQRSLFEARLLHLDSLHRYAAASAELERLLGRGFAASLSKEKINENE